LICRYLQFNYCWDNSSLHYGKSMQYITVSLWLLVLEYLKALESISRKSHQFKVYSITKVSSISNHQVSIHYSLNAFYFYTRTIALIIYCSMKTWCIQGCFNHITPNARYSHDSDEQSVLRLSHFFVPYSINILHQLQVRIK
jgi:hypothetical protein